MIPPLDIDHDPAVKELAEFFQTTLGFAPNSVLTMQRRPEIAKAFIGLNKAVMANAGRVTSEQKRLIALVVSANAGCRYCQAHTALAAGRFGASEQRIQAVWDFRQSPLFSDAERAAFEFALAASSVPNGVDVAVTDELRKHWDEGEIVEILGVVSLFGFLNRWNDSMGTELEDPACDAASKLLGSQGWSAGKHGSAEAPAE